MEVVALMRLLQSMLEQNVSFTLGEPVLATNKEWLHWWQTFNNFILCVNQTSRLPVLFNFGESFIDVRDFSSKLKETFPSNSSPLILFYDVSYQHAIDEISNVIEEEYKNLTVSKLLTDENKESCQYCSERNMISDEKLAIGCCNDKNSCTSGGCLGLKELNIGNVDSTASCSCRNSEQESDKVHKRFGRMFILPSETNLEECSMLYIGKQSLTLTNLMMSYNRNTFYTYDPNKRVMQKESLNVNKALMKRYFLMQKAKEAKTVGIVAGTLGVADYMSIIERLKNLLRKNGKKYYVFMMGKPNVAKMANFMEIDVFVLVACPENSLIDSQEFYRPIVTPFEMEIACSCGREWTGEYITDFRELLPGAASFVDFEDKGQIEKEEEPEFSLISGSLIHRADHYKKEKGNSTDVVLKNQENAVAMFGENSSASFLNTRAWKGLERKLGETEIVDAIQGRTGIAIQYTHETNTPNNSDSKDLCNN
ncbi:2-(3-amino-3-carboxypropyl)histidine synthase subunit 2-like isoform X2 [Rhopilema esculentum]|uniref:2-(3-amino-3-carboxypropyl)histidine synthase subunit 2-like isoform X2 n=1 Tax=Rhopilema esculentum TaxID=499914 RepID=UPI0031D96CFE